MSRIIFYSFFLLIIGIGACATFIFAEDDREYNDKGRRNPFISLVTPDGRVIKAESLQDKPQQLLLQGIFFGSSKDSYVIVNGQVITAGATIGDYIIVRIDPDKVIVRKISGEIEELRVSKD
jgi:hypothetical protein